MQATVIAIGMRGDALPLLALASGLRAAGVRVRCATHPDLEDLARARGLEYVPIRGRADALFGGAGGAALRDALAEGPAFPRLFDDYFSLGYRHLLEDVWRAVQGADVVVCWPWLRLAASLHEALRVPVVVASAYPPMYVPTSAFANPYQAAAEAADTPRARRRSWRLSLAAYRAGAVELDRWREVALGLTARGWRSELRMARALPHVLMYSPRVLPRPDDWPETMHVTGYALERHHPAPTRSDDLAAFVSAAAGVPRVAIGFSSQVVRDHGGLARAVEDAVRLTGVRAVVTSGFGALKSLVPSDRMALARWVPHEWLFRHVDGVVHHGGSGSVGMALSHGLPSVAVPFGYDQWLWGARVRAIGAGPAPLDPRTMTGESLARAIEAVVGDGRFRQRAAELGDELGREAGVVRATRVVVDAGAPARQ